MEASDRHKNKIIVIDKTGLLLAQKPTQVENILIKNNVSKILLSKIVSKINQQERVKSDNLKIPLIDWTYTLYNLRRSLQKKIKY